ncbi:YceI family protein [Pseudodesulfovibrio sp.]|nr:YceI family protein [Pseudodesulfovibrio sp.]
MQTQYAERLKENQVRDFLETGEGVLVDTLPPEHFADRHIPGAVNACVYEMTFLEGVVAIVPDKATPLVLYGAGPKSQDCMAAADKLARAGYTNLSVFPGGLEEWRKAGNTLEGEAPDEVEAPHPVLSLESKVYALVPDESIIHWTGRNNNGGHTGTLMLSRGELDATDDLAASFTIDMQTIKNTNLEGDELQPVLEAHLHSDDFFFTTLFPEATFVATQIKLTMDGEATRPNAMLQGKLALRGYENEIAFPAHIRNIDDGKVVILADLVFDRTQWGVIYGSSRFFQHLSYHVVYDFISIDFRLVLA